jgi:hypothetical protein
MTYSNNCPTCHAKLDAYDKTDFYFVLGEHYFFVHQDQEKASFYGNMAQERTEYEQKQAIRNLKV